MTQLLPVAPAKAFWTVDDVPANPKIANANTAQKRGVLRRFLFETMFREKELGELNEIESIKTNPFKFSVTLVTSSYCFEEGRGTVVSRFRG